MRMRYENRSGENGERVEVELFGKSRYEDITRELPGAYRYFKWKVIQYFLERMQPFDVTDPKPEFAKSVRSMVSDKLGLEDRKMRFYTAVKSPLDYYHQIDGWFEIRDGDKVVKRVTVDVTINPNKKDAASEYKADIVFLVPTDGLSSYVDKQQFMEYCESLAEEVALLMKEGHES